MPAVHRKASSLGATATTLTDLACNCLLGGPVCNAQSNTADDRGAMTSFVSDVADAFRAGNAGATIVFSVTMYPFANYSKASCGPSQHRTPGSHLKGCAPMEHASPFLNYQVLRPNCSFCRACLPPTPTLTRRQGRTFGV